MLILHGDNLLTSRKRLTEEIAKFKRMNKAEVVRFEGKNLSLTDLIQALESGSFWGSQRLVVIENFLGLARNRQITQILEYLKKNKPDKVIIWEKKLINSRTVNSLPGQAFVFKLPAVVFHFLDSFFPKNALNCLRLLRQTMEKDEPEVVFYLFSKHVRLLIIARDLGKEGLVGFPEWRAGKIIYQANKFSLNQLLQLYSQLLKIDWQQKTGQTKFSLSDQLDLLVSNL